MCDACRRGRRIPLNLAFPYDERPPITGPESPRYCLVSIDDLLKLAQPRLDIGARRS